MRIPIFQVDAFTATPFAGNPAAVCTLEEWLPDDVLLAIAAENALSETAFLVADSAAHPSPAGADHHLRWFTPAIEVELCGHATLASAHVLLTHLHPGLDTVSFDTLSGRLEVHREGDRLRMDLPALPPDAVEALPALVEALGVAPVEVLAAGRWLVVLDSEAQVVGLSPDIAALAGLDPPYVIVTAPGDPAGSGADFVSRFFAPGAGVAEDPVTGSAHCVLTPYWADRLGRPRLQARQVSARGGDLDCELAGDRVVLRGRCADYLEGTITI